MNKELDELKARLLSCATINNRILHGASVSVMDIDLAKMAVEYNNSIIQELGESDDEGIDKEESEGEPEAKDNISDSPVVSEATK